MKKNWKKILAAAGLGMMLMGTSLTPVTAFAAVDMQNLLTFVNDTMDDGSQIYYFEEVAVTLPADWKGKVAVQAQDTSVTFYHKASKEKWQENYGTVGGKLFSLSYSVNSDFTELPSYYYVGFGEESVMNYFLTFPTDVQGYMEDESISEEYQQLFSEIDYVKDHVCMRHAEPTDELSSFDETKAGYDGIWTKVEDLFELYLPTEWDACQPDEEDIAGGVKYISVSEDKAYICMAMATEPDNEETRKEIEQELADNNMTMMDVLKEQIDEQGFKLEKEAEINGIPCVFCSTDSLYGIVFIDQKDATQIDMVIFVGENRGNDQIVETVLRSVRWLPEE